MIYFAENKIVNMNYRELLSASKLVKNPENYRYSFHCMYVAVFGVHWQCLAVYERAMLS